jgi:D-isomer specific 2-hydroxyacid dehydrogenase, NAD binding domain
VAGAALDVFEEEPANHHKLFGLENVVATPHLGASTSEAQENAAIQIAEQMADYLLTGAVSNALNMPSSSIFLQGDTHRRAYARLEPQCFGGGSKGRAWPLPPRFGCPDRRTEAA